MLFGNLREFAEALIIGDKYKVQAGPLRETAEAIINGDKYKAPSGPLRDFADAIIHRDKYKVSNPELRSLVDAITNSSEIGEAMSFFNGNLKDKNQNQNKYYPMSAADVPTW